MLACGSAPGGNRRVTPAITKHTIGAGAPPFVNTTAASEEQQRSGHDPPQSFVPHSAVDNSDQHPDRNAENGKSSCKSHDPSG